VTSAEIERGLETEAPIAPFVAALRSLQGRKLVAYVGCMLACGDVFSSTITNSWVAFKMSFQGEAASKALK